MIFSDKKIILASASPRRSQLLRQAGIAFEIKIPEVEESYPEELPVEEVAPFLAKKKAEAARSFIVDKEIILAADSVVILHGIIYEKPVDRADAIRIIGQLSGQVHQVITGVCLLSKEKMEVFSGISKVHFDRLSLEEIEYYVDTCQPFDKAGAYAIQEWIGLCKISRIEGTYANIMGLPVDLVYRKLQDWEGIGAKKPA
ncbi:MAG: Maf-like protein [Saprospiraceae bacterium]|nr:MAG: Maf-like protein [Saprospiraceae bacterium]